MKQSNIFFFRDKGNDSDDNSDTANNNGDNELPSLESVFSDGSEISMKNRGKQKARGRGLMKKDKPIRM